MIRKTQAERLDRVASLLADSVCELSDEAILAEFRESGADPEAEAERTRLVLRAASRQLETVNLRLSNLGHTVNPSNWKRGPSGYRNTCECCGSLVSFETETGEMRGEALNERCPDRDQFVRRRREASRK